MPYVFDNEIMDNSNPVLVGADAGAYGLVTLLKNGVEVGHTTALLNGSFQVQALPTSNSYQIGLNVLAVQATDAAGHISPSSLVDVVLVPHETDGNIVTDLSSAVIGPAVVGVPYFSFVGSPEALLLTDSTLGFGPDTNAATTQRLYWGLLGRAADTAALTSADALVANGGSPATVAARLLASPEYAASHAAMTDMQFITSLYQGLLARAPDPAGVAAAATQLASGTSRAQLAVEVANSRESKAYLANTTYQLYVPNAAGTLAHELYETGLGREVDLPSLASFKVELAHLTPAQLAAQIAGSAEFTAAHATQSNAAYVNSLFQDGLGRPAGPGAGSAYWVGVLNNGASRGNVLLGIATSSEAAGHLTHSLSPTYPGSPFPPGV